jgi:hypothetical protein
MSIDRRIREGLRNAAEPIEPIVPSALATVERRAGLRQRGVRFAQLTAAAAVLVLIAILTPVLRDHSDPINSDAGQSALTGTYIVDVADSAVARRDGLTGRWIVTLRRDGVVDLIPPTTYRGDVSGISYRVVGDVLRTDAFIDSPGCQASDDQIGTYHWTRNASSVLFTTVADTCDVRLVLFIDQPWRVAP